MKKIYVIQEHHARNLHWDLRLEKGMVLKSWAVPKTPPRKKGLKRLAIEVTDHAKSYAKFEGKIEEGYGKGTVKIWDKGTYELEEWKKNKILIHINGKKLKGDYALIRMKDSKNWLFFKR